MKRCPKCTRDYYDDSLSFCLDDGSELLEGPASGDEPETAIFGSSGRANEAPTRKVPAAVLTDETRPTSSFDRRTIIVAASLLVLVGVFSWVGYKYYGGVKADSIESIAVMPIVNVAESAELEYLSDGITESLINSLSQVPNVSVKARSSVFTYKGKEVTTQQVADDLSVQAVLNGQLRQMGDQIVLNVELVDAATGDQLWGERYARRMADLVQLPGEIARDVSGKLRAKLTGPERQKVAKNYAENTEAYQLYLRGRYHWNRRTPDDISRSVDYFQQAIDKDPSYALAYAALAEAYILTANYRIERPDEAYPKARAAAEKAIEIDGTLAEPHNALATVLSNHEWKFAEAENAWQKALSLNPNYASAHQWYAEFLIAMGRNADALSEMKRAQELDPVSLIINGMVGVTLKLNGRPEEGLQQLKKTLEMDPNFPRTHLYLAELYQSLGRYEEAVDELAKHAILNGASASDAERLSVMIKNAAKAHGAKGYARALLEIMQIQEAPTPFGPPPAIIAAMYVQAGDHDKAFSILEKAYRDRDESILMLKDYRFDAIKTDARYKDLIRRVGLPE